MGTLRLEPGKQYLKRDGTVSGALGLTGQDSSPSFRGRTTGLIYTKNGRYIDPYNGPGDQPHLLDLVTEWVTVPETAVPSLSISQPDVIWA